MNDQKFMLNPGLSKDYSETYIRIKPQGIPESFCKKVIAAFEEDTAGHKKGETHTGYIEGAKESTDLSIHFRRSEKCELWEEIDSKLFEYVSLAFIEYIEEVPAFKLLYPPFGDTGYLVQKYEVNKGFFKPHSDSSSFNISTYIATCIIYLNTVSEGGETDFPDWGIKIKPEVGKMLWYPAAVTHVHAGLKPISNEKYIITTFMFYLNE